MIKLLRNNRNGDYRLLDGITLIALVVTIIVLLILAGIAINLSIGNNGLFSRAKNAANTWREAEANEAVEIKNVKNIYDETLNNLGLNGNGGGNKTPIDKITGEEKTNTETTDKNGNRIVVPAGFKVVNPDQTVNEGIVIEDVNANNEDTVGNQFVWIPCTIDGVNNTLKYDRYAFTRENPTWNYRQSFRLGTNGEKEKDADGSYKIVREDDTSYYYHEALPEEERQSIKKYGGYYIGRYEVVTDSARSESSKGNITVTARVKENLPVYNYVTRDEAVTIAERMYTGKSKLCSSYAWDTALQFIGGTYAVNSEGENYSGGLKNTGYHSEKNIYDMGGNLKEWTTETYTYSSYPCVLRGGDYNNNDLNNPAGYRTYTSTSHSKDYIGLRCILYV